MAQELGKDISAYKTLINYKKNYKINICYAKRKK
tara:strand:- start:1480 stop:1581 length:102 start_codon:yes stop_codon:yes gene_type:complete